MCVTTQLLAATYFSCSWDVRPFPMGSRRFAGIVEVVSESVLSAAATHAVGKHSVRIN